MSVIKRPKELSFRYRYHFSTANWNDTGLLPVCNFPRRCLKLSDKDKTNIHAVSVISNRCYMRQTRCDIHFKYILYMYVDTHISLINDWPTYKISDLAIILAVISVTKFNHKCFYIDCTIYKISPLSPK